jgi:hypothetical protein
MNHTASLAKRQSIFGSHIKTMAVVGFLFITLQASPAQGQYTLSAAPSEVTPGSVITVSWTAPAGHSAQDWIGLYAVGQPDTSFISWEYTGGASSGSLPFTAPGSAGQYEFRCFTNNTFNRVATSNTVTVSSPSPSHWAPNGNNIHNTNTGNVGIGTTTPDRRLTLALGSAIKIMDPVDASWGTILSNNSSGDGFLVTGGHNLTIGAGWDKTIQLGDPNFTANGGKVVIPGGNVGIGTAAPTAKLHVAGQIYSSMGGFKFPDDTVQTTAATGSGGSSGWTDGGASVNLTNSSASVGIGTSTPAAKLHVVGASGPQNNTGTPAPDAFKVLGGTGGNAADAGPGGIGGAIALTGGTGGSPFQGSQSAFGGVGGAINITGGTGGPNLFPAVGGGKGGDVLVNGGTGVANSDGNILLANLRGNVGLGTTSPAFRLDVSGEVNATGLRINGIPISTGGSSQWTTSGPNIYYMGNVGIGTDTPGNKLEVVAANPAGPSGASSIRVLSGSSSAYNGYAIGRTATEGYWGIAGGADHYASGSVAGDVIFRGETNLILSNAGAANVYLKSNGNVGFGTITPSTKLHVVGDGKFTGSLTVDGNIAAKYQDVAEWVPSTQELSAGTVVVLDHERSNHVVASSQTYDTRVAGVISAQPGITLGENGVGKVLVATTGRVKIKVDASSAPIQVGDLLVTGDREGFAMKSLPLNIGGVQLHRPGTLVGKALESLAKGTGEILVLLSLQ